MEAKRYLPHAEPEPAAFYGYAMLTRFSARESQVLPCQWQFGKSAANSTRIFAAALRSPQGQLTLILANREGLASNVHFRWDGLKRKTTLYRYELTTEKVKKLGFTLVAENRLTISRSQPDFNYTVPPLSLVVFTTYDLPPDAPGVIAERK